jgi:hypothetical protein
MLDLSISINSCGDASVDVDLPSARGAVLGNLLLWAAAAAAVVIVAAVYSLITGATLRSSAVVLGLPSPLFPLVVVTVPSTVHGTFQMILASSCSLDKVFAVVGVVMILSPIFVLAALAVLVPRSLSLIHHKRHAVAPLPSWCCPSSTALARVIARCFVRQYRWVANVGSVVVEPLNTPDEIVVGLRLDRSATVILLEYTVVWSCCGDVVFLTLGTILAALSKMNSADLCRGAGVVLLLLYGGQLLLCVVVRPFTAHFSFIHTLFSLGMTCVGVACQVVYLYRSEEANVDLDSIRGLLVTASVIDLVISGVGVLRSSFDVIAACGACKRHAVIVHRALWARFRGSEGRREATLCVGIAGGLATMMNDDWSRDDSVLLADGLVVRDERAVDNQLPGNEAKRNVSVSCSEEDGASIYIYKDPPHERRDVNRNTNSRLVIIDDEAVREFDAQFWGEDGTALMQPVVIDNEEGEGSLLCLMARKT